LILELFTIIAPVTICALIGFVWTRMGYSFDVNQITVLVTYVGTPCLVFTTFIDVQIDPETFTEMALATVATIVLFTVIGAVILKTFGIGLQNFLPPMVWANMGNMGIPLCLFAFGQEGLALAITYFAVDAVMLFTFGVAFSAGAFSVKRFLKLPFIYAVIAALVFSMGNIEVPRWIANTSELLAGLTIPLMLIMLGVTLGSLKITGMKRTIALSSLRLIMGFGVGWIVAYGFGFEGAARGVLIMQAAMPVAVYNYLFAVRYNRAPDEVAGMIVISTLMSFLTLPMLLWYVL